MNYFQRLKSFKKHYSSGSIAFEVLHSKSNIKRPLSSIQKVPKLEYFPAQPFIRHQNTQVNYTINPDSSYKVLWESIFVSVLLFRLFLIPFIISFSPGLFKKFRSLILITDSFSILDIFVKLNTGFLFKGFLITNRLKIVKNYFRNSFFIDILASFPLQEMPFVCDFILENDENDYKLILLVKFVNLYRIKGMFYELEDKFVSINSVTALKFLHFSILIILLIHWTSCLVHFLYFKDLPHTAELWGNFVENESFRYLNYLYYILFTVTSIGYFSLNISTPDQRLLNILIMCFDIIIFAYILGKLESTLNSYQKQGKETKRLISKCKSFISQNKIPNLLRHKIIRYIIHIREKEAKGAENELETLKNLSLPLKEEIYTQTRGHIIAKSKIFTMYKGSFLKFVGYHLRMQYFGPEDRVFDTGENGSLVYFIQNGEIEIFHLATTTTFKILTAGKCFGEISFFLETTRSASAKSLNFSELLTLDRLTLNKILSCRPYEKDLTHQVIHEANKVGLSVLNIKCYFCRRLGHIAASCKEYIIPIDQKKFIKTVDRSRSKKVNLNDAFKFTFQRKEKKPLKRPYKLLNTVGKKFNFKENFKKNPGLVKKASNYSIRVKPAPIITHNLAVIDEDSSSEGESSTLPKYMQYRNAFIENSRNRKLMKIRQHSIELFDVQNFPKIFLTTPSDV